MGKKVAKGKTAKEVVQEKTLKEPTSQSSNQSDVKKIFISIPFLVGLTIWILIWIIPKGPAVVDPWYKAVKLVDSGNRIQDKAEKLKLMEVGGEQLRQLSKDYPMHARVHFYLGYYYFLSQKWDSALVSLKEAARIDSGSSINSIWPDAHDFIAKCAMNKANSYINTKQLDEAKKSLLEGYKYYPNHPYLNRYLGNVYYDMKDFENAFRHLMISFNGNPKDDAVANLIGILYNMKGDVNNARAYFAKAVELNPNNTAAKGNLNALNTVE